LTSQTLLPPPLSFPHKPGITYSSEEKRWLKDYATLNGAPLSYETPRGMVEMSGVVPDSSKCETR